MNDIYPIYRNSFGMSFQWKRDIVRNSFNKIQIIFRDTGFYLTIEQIREFSENLSEAKNQGACICCENSNPETRSILLKTPFTDVDMAVNEMEIELITELIQGTLFQINLDSYINNLCNN